MNSDMIVEIVSALGGVPRHVGTEDGYEEVARLSGEEKLIVWRDLWEIGLVSFLGLDLS